MLLLFIPFAVIVMYVVWRKDGRGATRNCRWRLDRSGATPRHFCVACGATAATGTEETPNFCARKRG